MSGGTRSVRRGNTCPKMSSGWDMKSVMRSSMLRGSSTKVGKVTLERSIPTLSCEMRASTTEPSFASLEWERSSQRSARMGTARTGRRCGPAQCRTAACPHRTDVCARRGPSSGSSRGELPDLDIYLREHDLPRTDPLRDVLSIERTVRTVLPFLDRHREPSQPIGAEPALPHHPSQFPSQSPLVLLPSEERDRLSASSPTAYEHIIGNSNRTNTNTNSNAPVRPIRWT